METTNKTAADFSKFGHSAKSPSRRHSLLFLICALATPALVGAMLILGSDGTGSGTEYSAAFLAILACAAGSHALLLYMASKNNVTATNHDDVQHNFMVLRQRWEHGAARTLAQAQRKALPACVALLELDNFAELRFLLGGHKAEALISELTQALNNSRSHALDQCGRITERTFAVVWYACSAEQAQQRANSLSKVLRKLPFRYLSDGQIHEITASIGIIERPAFNSAPLKHLASRAAERLSAAQSSGHDAIACSSLSTSAPLTAIASV